MWNSPSKHYSANSIISRMDLVTFSKLSLICLFFVNNSLSLDLKSHQIHAANNRVNTVETNIEFMFYKLKNSLRAWEKNFGLTLDIDDYTEPKLFDAANEIV